MKLIKVLVILAMAAAFLFLYKNISAASRTLPAAESAESSPAVMVMMTMTPAPTATMMPSPTTDHAATLGVAQATADEARRVNAIITAEHEQRIFEQVQITAAHEKSLLQIYAWTQQAAGTVIPLTSTAQVIHDTKTAAAMDLIFMQATGTAIAPTQQAAIINLEYKKKYGWLDYLVRGAVAIFLVALAVVMVTVVRQSKPADDGDAKPKDAMGWIGEKTPAGFTARAYVIPCARDQWDEFAHAIINGEKTLGINQWEGSGTLFTRDSYIPIREFLNDRNLVDIDANGHAVINDAGRSLLQFWIGNPDHAAFIFQP